MPVSKLSEANGSDVSRLVMLYTGPLYQLKLGTLKNEPREIGVAKLGKGHRIRKWLEVEHIELRQCGDVCQGSFVIVGAHCGRCMTDAFLCPRPCLFILLRKRRISSSTIAVSRQSEQS